jgi:NAD(P)-dependent dehydrogenase (short-subunit alcohol dehydrogenase family)
VDAVAPGGSLTERVKARLAGAARTSAFTDNHLLGLAEPIDNARAALYLASDESPRTTGHILVVDSGLTIH